jgi:hypothetical protein
LGVQLDSIFNLVAYYLFCCSVDHSVYVGKEKIRFQENTFCKLCSHCRFVLFVFAALFDIAIVRSNTMKKFFALLFANILLIHIGCVPQLGRLYAYPIYHLFTGSGYENEWFCNPLWCFIVAWPSLLQGYIPHTLCYAVSITILLLLSLEITVWLSFYCNWPKKWLLPVYVIFATSCLLSFPVTYSTATAYPFLYWTTY